VIKEFYQPFHENLIKKEREISKKDLTEEETNEVCEKCGKPMIIKMGRYGKFLACTGFPECRNTRPLLEKEINSDKTEDVPIDELCEKCGSPMTIKHGRYGPFLACSAYPKCKNIKPINKSTGVKCPKCEQGEIIEKRSKKGRTFYSCNQYPECKFALWQKPIKEKCPKCGGLMVMEKNEIARCLKSDSCNL
jgi:DNA topoisomerase-1